MIRAVYKEDAEKIRKIHENHYNSEFSLPDFNRHFIHAFAITDSKDDIISVGGIRPILEVVALTDKDRSVKERVEALNTMLTVSAFIASADKFDELHCFVQDDKWFEQLKKKGFVETRGRSLVFKI